MAMITWQKKKRQTISKTSFLDDETRNGSLTIATVWYSKSLPPKLQWEGLSKQYYSDHITNMNT